MIDIVVRSAIPADLGSTRDIYAEYVRGSVATFEEEVPEPAEWRRRYETIREHGLPYLVAELPQAGSDISGIVGYAYCAPWKARPAYRRTAENSVYLAPSATGKGLGRTLLEALVTEAGRADVRELIAVITSTMDASLRLHRRCGFAEAGTLTGVGYKHGQWLDTVLMQRSLAADGSTPGT
ncbi:phosphinothricin acetyltransferase [Haloechinothrix alba]|uniref:Phosphinothricin acetyltransferase n=1 Tax=Haloechinothrix alba TaxID=664784 RepID=A0A238V0B9_9PSEU|nr:GNAT family N-acetyltransferase [Haloechinothrix alba]SNR27885.1 phosphinothricin acetyltransferase [Haloechinothrix alba]